MRRAYICGDADLPEHYRKSGRDYRHFILAISPIIVKGVFQNVKSFYLRCSHPRWREDPNRLLRTKITLDAVFTILPFYFLFRNTIIL